MNKHKTTKSFHPYILVFCVHVGLPRLPIYLMPTVCKPTHLTCFAFVSELQEDVKFVLFNHLCLQLSAFWNTLFKTNIVLLDQTMGRTVTIRLVPYFPRLLITHAGYNNEILSVSNERWVRISLVLIYFPCHSSVLSSLCFISVVLKTYLQDWK